MSTIDKSKNTMTMCRLYTDDLYQWNQNWKC